jgi:hypothetical protein
LLTGALSSCGGPTGLEGTGAGSLPFDGRSPLVPPARTMRVLVELRRPSLATQVASQTLSPARQKGYVASLRDEVTALRGALQAKGVKLRDPVLFARVWNGFAATVDTRDLPVLRAVGLRVEPVRRFYGAAAQGAQGTAKTAEFGPGGTGKPSVALLDSAVDRAAPGLGGRVVPGFDAVGGRPGARERHGTAVAQVLAQALGPGGGRIVSIRVAGLQPDPETGGRLEYGTTDQLLAGLERAVDPNGDGDTSDHVPVALVGVNSPYAGFADSPEALAGAGARALGTLVVAPAGNEGRSAGQFGTVGSPAAAPGVLAVGALEGGGAPALPAVRLGLATAEGRALLRGALLGGDGGGRALKAPVAALTGPTQASPRASGRALGGSPLEYFAVNGSEHARGRVVVVAARSGAGAGPALAVRAAAAAQAGAAALVVCEPDPHRPLAALPDGGSGIPVIGLRGGAAKSALELTPRDGGFAFVSAPERRTAPGAIAPATSSSVGPTYSLAPKPDLAAPGTATVTTGGGRAHVIAGTSVAAARAAAAAALVYQSHPNAKPDDLAAALIGTARPLGPPLSTGAGELQPKAAPAAVALVEPATLDLPRRPARTAFTITRQLTVANLGSGTATVSLSARIPGLRAAVTPATLPLGPGARQRITLRVSAAAGGRPPGYASGRVTATGAGAPVAAVVGLPVGPPPPVRLGPLALVAANGRIDGVRFTAGALATRAGVRSVEPLGSLRLELVNASGRVVRELTPVGGAPDLLPGEYAYTLTTSVRKTLPGGVYSFVAHARATAGGGELQRKSPSFRVR